MREVEATLAAFAPDLVMRLCERATEPSSPPLLESFGTLLQVDIAGSSALAEKIATESQHNAADEFAILLNKCFDCIISTIQSFGGEIVEFAGDGVTALWEHENSKEVAARSVLSAATAALQLKRLMSTVRSEHTGPVAFRSAISTGPLIIAGIGGLDGDRRLFMTGPAIGDLAVAMNKASAAEVAVSASAWQLGQDLLRGRGSNKDVYLLEAISEAQTLSSARSGKRRTPSHVKGTRSYVPKNVRRLSEAALVEWLAELRTTTMVFCRVKSEQVSDQAEICKIHNAIRLIQEKCNRYHGFLETVRADDKGTTFMVAFGLPPTSLLHKRSAVIDFADHAARILQSFGYEPGIGIATGRVFQGPIGVAARRQLAFVGSPTILGCRLMQISSNEILCDEATKILAEADAAPWSFRECGPYQLKGFDQAVPVFGAVRKAERQKAYEAGAPKIVGRSAEIEALEEQIAKIVSGHYSLTVIEGEAGVGKTQLVQEALYRSDNAGCRCALAAADALTQATPYAPWRQILTDLFDLPQSNVDRSLERELRRLLTYAGLDPELLPLANDVFGVGIDETQKTKAISGLARAKATQKLFANLIDYYAEKPILLVFEDVHWIDLPSLDLCALIHERCRHVGIILTQRPAGGDTRQELRRLIGQRRARRIALSNFDRDETAELIRAHISVQSIPRTFLDTIHSATEGNPFFVEQVLRSYQRQRLQPDSGAALDPRSLDLMTMDMPSTVETAILQRVDELGPKEQLLLKAASAIGDAFKIDALMHIYAREPAPKAKHRLDALINTGFIVKRGPHAGASYSICHQLMRKVVYDLIPRYQLAEIHGRIARWYESGREGPRANHFALLAHHWLRAGAQNKSLAYHSRAGERSLKSGAHTEASYLFRTALELASDPNLTRAWRCGNLRLARWESQLAQSLWGIGALDAASVHACRALRLIGFRIPDTRMGWLLLAVRQWSALPLPVRTGFGWNRVMRRRRQALESGAGAAIVVAQVAYYTSDALRMLAGSLLSLRLGSSGVTGASVGRSYAYLGYMAGIARLGRVAERLFRQAQARSAADRDAVGLAYTHGGEALYHLGFGRWDLAASAVGSALQECRGIGDPQLTEIALTLKAMLHYFTGDFAQSDRDFAEIFTSAKVRLSKHHLAWGAYGRAENLLHLGKTRQAHRFIQIAKKVLQAQTDLHSELICHGVEAVTQLRLGNVANARTAAVAAIDLAQSVVPNNFSSLEGYAAPIETLLHLQMVATVPAETRPLTYAFRSLSNYARMFPIGRPRLWYLRGWRSYTEGDRDLAQKNWLTSLRWASKLQMRYDEYRACEVLHLVGSLAPAELEPVVARGNKLSIECGYSPSSIDLLQGWKRSLAA